MKYIYTYDRQYRFLTCTDDHHPPMCSKEFHDCVVRRGPGNLPEPCKAIFVPVKTRGEK